MITAPLPRIEVVIVGEKSTLTVQWRDGGSDHVDLAGWIATGGADFQRLGRREDFITATVGSFGLAVEWCGDEELAIDSYHLQQLAEQQRGLSGRDLAAWQERMQVSNQEAADILDIALSTWHSYKASPQVPRPVQIVCRALEQDKVMFEAYYVPRRAGRPRQEQA
ncbi:MAG: hypothetical protein ACOVN0_03290 [Niveispirillum sp.]|uniref:hypothetical protein n=1 Tax=Niveispirillum sp. TaxID=1917217 RepID=UPI003BA5AF03